MEKAIILAMSYSSILSQIINGNVYLDQPHHPTPRAYFAHVMGSHKEGEEMIIHAIAVIKLVKVLVTILRY